MIGLIAGTLLLEAPPAHAIFGIRAARTVIAARKARKAMSSSDAETKATATEAKATTAEPGTTTSAGENQSLEDLKRLEEESKKID